MNKETQNNWPQIAVDTVIFTIANDKLQVLLVKIKKGTYKGRWAVPGGLVKYNESLDEAAKRVLKEETELDNNHLEQLYTFGNPKRDMRKHTVSVAYFALVNSQNIGLKEQSYYGQVRWWPVDELPEMAFDHEAVIGYAKLRLKAKMEYSNIVYSLMPKYFSLTEMQKVYEIIGKKKLDKRNFRKQMSWRGIIKKAAKVKKGDAHRPAQLYCFKKRRLILWD